MKGALLLLFGLVVLSIAIGNLLRDRAEKQGIAFDPRFSQPKIFIDNIDAKYDEQIIFGLN